MRFVAIFGTLFLLLLCSCAAESRTQLPADLTINKGAGRGDELFVTLHLQDGESFLCILDTGSSSVLLDRSLEPKLGRCLWVQKISPWYGMKKIRLYRAPKLYLGDVPLQTSGWVWTSDLSPFSQVMEQTMHTNRPIMGVIGMSCLKHYCIQLDFTANKVRFLDNQNANKQEWGKAFGLKKFKGDFAMDDNLAGIKGANSVIDTGCDFDCYLTPKMFQCWTNQMGPLPKGQARYPDATLGGESYTNVYFHGDGDFNGIGLTFLSRNLVTFDFPNRTLYLKKTSTGPVIDEDTRSAMNFLRDLNEKNELPGCPKGERLGFNYFAYPASGIFDAGKKGAPTVYHYAVGRDSGAGTWTLQRAWQTDANGKTIKEYPVN